MKNHVIKVKPNSEGEYYFVNKLIRICKDGVICRLGSTFGKDYNEYEITHSDFRRVQKFIANQKAGSM